MLTPLSWLALAGLLAALDLLEQTPSMIEDLPAAEVLRAMSDPAFIARIELLALKSFEYLHWPVLVVMGLVFMKGLLFKVLPHPGRPQPAPGQRAPRLEEASASTILMRALKLAPMVATGCAVIGLLAVAVAWLNNDNHWDNLPWVSPPYVEKFVARHPGMSVGQMNSKTRKREVRDAQGHTVRLSSYEMDGAQLSLVPCPAKLVAAQLGGIPPYPGIACSSVATLRNSAGTSTMFQFVQSTGSDSPAIMAHFQAWADKHAGSLASGTSGDTHFNFFASVRADDAWKLRLDSRKGGATTIVIEQHQNLPEPAQPAPTPGKAPIKLKIAN